MGIKICPKCGGKVSESRNLCIHCGYIFPSFKKCPDCGKEVPIDAKECPDCGFPFSPLEVNDPSICDDNFSTESEDFTIENDKNISVVDEDNIETNDSTLNEPTNNIDNSCGNSFVDDKNDFKSSDNLVKCPYCGSILNTEIGGGFYRCSICHNKFVNSNYIIPKNLNSYSNNNVEITNSNVLVGDSNCEKENICTLESASSNNVESKSNNQYKNNKIKKVNKKLIYSGIGVLLTITALIIVLCSTSRNNVVKIIEYGMYPQTHVNDSSLISSLNTLNNPNEYGYYIYNNEYYYKYNATPYTLGYKFDNGSTIISGNYYWFKVEPIKWIILSKKFGTYLLTSESLLINHRYAASSNNYKNSEIRSWLNSDFYNQAFFLDNDNIKVTEVDNSASSTGDSTNSYACENTNDKLFLLSYKELTNFSYGFSPDYSTDDTVRQCKTTDFARAHGAYMNTSTNYYQNGWYYTRSPSYDFYNSSSVRDVYDDGHIGGGNGVNYSIFGVRPALRLSL